MKPRLAHVALALALAAPATVAFALPTPLAVADAAADLAAVAQAASAACASATAHGFAHPAIAAALEQALEGAYAFSTSANSYYVLYHDAAFTFTVSHTGDTYKASTPTSAATPIPTYDSLAAAQAAHATDSAFVTLGLATKGDRGHGYYEKAASPAATDVAATVGTTTYRLVSGEDAVTVYQLGYTSESSASPAIAAFHASSFHTLVFPSGEYRLTEEIWSKHDDRSYYGLDATLYTNSAIERDGKNAPHNGLWLIRGDVRWGEGATYTKDDGKTARQDGYHTVRNIEICGLGVETRAGSDNYRYQLVVRNARNVTVRGCQLRAGQTNGLPLEFYGDYDGVTVADCIASGWGCIEIRDLCNHVDNHPASALLDDDNPDGARNVVVRGCTFVACSFDEILPIFAGNEQGLGTTTDGVFTEYPILTHCLVDNVLVENNRFVGSNPPTEKQRVVAITCGYQDSPVKNVRIEHNTWDVAFNNYLILYGYAQDCTFSHNTVTVRSTKDAPTLMPVFRSTHSRTGPTTNVRFEHNTLTFPDEAAKVSRMVDSAFTPGSITFSHNDVTVAGTVERVFDSTSEAQHNTFHLQHAKFLYDRVGEVAHNAYDIASLGGLYESYGTNAATDLNIHDETATIAELTGNLLTFNGAPRYNGHSLTFTNCAYDIAEATAQYHYVAYKTNEITDHVNVTFDACYLPHFDSGSAAGIAYNDDGKVTLATTAAPLLTLESAESVDAGGGFTPITPTVTLATSADVTGRGAVPSLTGTVVGGFDLTTAASEAELTFRPASTVATSGDVLAVYRWDTSAWKPAAYAEVHAGRFTLNLAAGTYALVNKDKGTAPTPTKVPLNPSDATWREKNALRDALQTPGVYSADGPLSFPELSTSAACANAEVTGVTFQGMGATSVLRVAADGTAPNHLYFSDCTFDNVEFNFLRPGTYVFNRCEFKNSATGALIALADSGAITGDVHIYVFNSRLHDNKPPLADWNSNSDARYYRYAALAIRAPNSSLTASDTTIEDWNANCPVLVERDHAGARLYFEHSAILRTAGTGITMNVGVAGRIDDNDFEDMGSLRGKDGYEPSWNEDFAPKDADGSKIGKGMGVGGNAVFASTGVTCFNMRVRGNRVARVMENALEGHFWCIDDNTISGTGWRWGNGEDDYTTVSTEGIWGGSRYVRNNRLTLTHKHGIVVERREFATWPVEVSGNTIDKAGWGLTNDVEGIRVVAGSDTSARPVDVRDNDIAGYARITRVTNPRADVVVTFTNNVDRTVRAEALAPDDLPSPGAGDAEGTPSAPEPTGTPIAAETPSTAGTPATANTPASAQVPATPDTADTPATAEVPATVDAPESPDGSGGAGEGDAQGATGGTSGSNLGSDGSGTSAFAPSWSYVDGSWRWENAPGEFATGWVWDGSSWYLLSASGDLVSGWVWDAGDWFYLDERHDGGFGSMVVGWLGQPEGWYWMTVDARLQMYGSMARSAWVLDRGTWYLAGPDGVMLTGWQWFEGAWYYLGDGGALLTSARTPDGSWVDASGRWVA